MTHTWTKIVLVLAVILPAGAIGEPAVRPMGVWVTSDGSEAMMSCPTEDMYGDRALKMPKWCKAQVAGVWLSLDAHSGLKARAVRAETELAETKRALDELRESIKGERLELSSYFKQTSSRLELIKEQVSQEKFSWSSAGIGIATGMAFCGGAWLGASF